MVQPDYDLALEISVAWNDQQGSDARFSNGKKKRKDDFDADKLPPRGKYTVGNQLARADVVAKSAGRHEGSDSTGRQTRGRMRPGHRRGEDRGAKPVRVLQESSASREIRSDRPGRGGASGLRRL